MAYAQNAVYPQTGYAVDPRFSDFFESRGGIQTFGFPVSRVFAFLGCPVQMFQRQILQLCPGQSVALINLLDPDIFPYTTVNGTVFPQADDHLKETTPRVDDPDYAAAIVAYVRETAPDVFTQQPVNFGSYFFGQGGLEIWGAPISLPATDPTNTNFVYQRFQRGIMHYAAGVGTESVLLADYLKAILMDSPDLPTDLAVQAGGSRFFAQYCPSAATWVCRPDDLPGTDLTLAFERLDGVSTDTPTPSPTPTQSAGATATSTSTPEPTATATEQSTPSPTLEPSSTPTPTPVPSNTPTPAATATLSPTTAAATTSPASGASSPTATATQAPTTTPTVAPTATQPPSPTATPAPTTTATPHPSATPSPTPTPTPFRH